MIYDVYLSMEAVEDVLRITTTSGAKSDVVNASRQIQDSLRADPESTGVHLSEGLYYIDREPLRAFFAVDQDAMSVEIVNVKQL